MSGVGSTEPPESGRGGFAGTGAGTVLPGGTVTFVFTDIAGSTELLKRLGDRYADALADHRSILREEFGSRGGREIDTQGDAFFFGFQRARDAVAAAVAGQRALAAHVWPDGVELLVRMSLHTGEPVVGEEGYVGIDVHRAARICSAGHGGQVLLSATTAALVAGGLPDGVQEVELGEVRLKDLDRPERVYQLEIDGLPQSFPPLRADAEEPMDFGERLARKIEADVERQIEESFSFSGGKSSRPVHTTRLAAIGLFNLVMVVAAIVVIVLLIRLIL
jgi:class 3 adenylate cyclase